ncbi:PadR family transcriptional regulator [Streptomyces lydicus]|uniref:PadR family transcriptional regulator n=1 Tax=Streptomyces lydicus TaxID=47763 RepID=UPI00342F32DE
MVGDRRHRKSCEPHTRGEGDPLRLGPAQLPATLLQPFCSQTNTILLRLERNGLVQVTKRPSGVGPPRKFYTLNDAGREELAKFWAKWQYLSSRINRLKEGGR